MLSFPSEGLRILKEGRQKLKISISLTRKKRACEFGINDSCTAHCTHFVIESVSQRGN